MTLYPLPFPKLMEVATPLTRFMAMFGARQNFCVRTADGGKYTLKFSHFGESEGTAAPTIRLRGDAARASCLTRVERRRVSGHAESKHGVAGEQGAVRSGCGSLRLWRTHSASHTYIRARFLGLCDLVASCWLTPFMPQ